jgi:hypothetical protein
MAVLVEDFSIWLMPATMRGRCVETLVGLHQLLMIVGSDIYLQLQRHDRLWMGRGGDQ